MKKKTLLFLGLFLLVCGVFFLTTIVKPQSSKQGVEKFREILVGDTLLKVEVVTQTKDIEKGLSGRNEIGSDGMLFVFASRTSPTFWMIDMRFPLDFIWIDTDHVADITKNVPNPVVGTPIYKLPLYSPKTAVTYVLEVPSGFIQSRKVRVGDVFQWK